MTVHNLLMCSAITLDSTSVIALSDDGLLNTDLTRISSLFLYAIKTRAVLISVYIFEVKVSQSK
mgnify:CR=1 FL=1